MANADMAVANTILQQLAGGARPLAAMIGAHSFNGEKDRVWFKFKARAKNGSNTLLIVLSPDDTYVVTFLSARGTSIKYKGKFEGVYAENLRPLFERETGLVLGVPRVRGLAKGAREKEVVTYTTAPADYDWFGTYTVGIVAEDSRGKIIRKVKGPASRVEMQRGRYMSGNHLAVDEAEYKKLVAYKLVGQYSPSLRAASVKAMAEARHAADKTGHAVGGKLAHHPASERFMILFPDGRSSFFGSKKAADYAANAYNSRTRGFGVTVIDNARRSRPSRFNRED